MRLDITSMVCVLVLLRLHTPQREEEDCMEGLAKKIYIHDFNKH